MDIELRGFESYFFGPKSPSDAAQVPLVGATFHVTRQGATSTSPDPVVFNEQETHDVPVVDSGLVQVGDELFVDVDTSVQLSVAAVSADRRTLTLQNLGGFTSVAAGARLRPSAPPPLVQGPARAAVWLPAG